MHLPPLLTESDEEESVDGELHGDSDCSASSIREYDLLDFCDGVPEELAQGLTSEELDEAYEKFPYLEWVIIDEFI